MAKKDNNQYILGTEQAELHRLGLQHQVWSSEARKGWEIAEFAAGQTILDLGCGPGYCTLELGYIVSSSGKVIGVDKSKAFIDFLETQNRSHGLNIELIHADFDNLEIPDNSLDGIYCRWAMAWIPNPEEILEKLERMLVPGGVMVFQEYYDWSTFQTEPSHPNLEKGIAAILDSFSKSPGDINIGRRLPSMLYDLDMEVINIRSMTKMATPDQLIWQWPSTFLNIYMPKLIDSGAIDASTVKAALEELELLSFESGSTLLCPQMVEVVAVKP